MNPSASTELPIILFTDGACSGNPGPGGYGYVLATPDGKVIEGGGAMKPVTNNMMEMMGVIEGLRAAANLSGPLAIYTDSTYVIRGATQWIWGWRSRGWKTAEGKDVANQDLWKTLSGLIAARNPKPEWHYVRGHRGTPGNERVDAIASGYTQGRRVELFRGSLLQYGHAIHDIPEDTSLPEQRPKEEKKAAAFSYLSVVNGKVERHADWKSCEARVKGRPGAKFKKAMSVGDESKVLADWGYSLTDVK